LDITNEGGAVFMTKYTRAERIAAALAVEAGGSPRQVAKQFGISRRTVQWSVKLYRARGEAGFQPKKKVGYTAAQKLEVLETMRSQGISSEAAAVQFGITGAATVRGWERRYMENGIEGLQPKKKGRRRRAPKPKVPLTPYEQLLAENEYLRAENEYLKKLNALVAEREAREKPDRPTE
jgi:transposase